MLIVLADPSRQARKTFHRNCRSGPPWPPCIQFKTSEVFKNSEVYCPIGVRRSQVGNPTHIVSQTDPYSFLVIGVAQQALGGTTFPRVRHRTN